MNKAHSLTAIAKQINPPIIMELQHMPIRASDGDGIELRWRGLGFLGVFE